MFVHLHTHSEFSPLDGMVRISEAFGTVKEAGQAALAITDHGNLAAAWAAQKAADSAGVKYIAGMEAYLAIGSRAERNVMWVPADDDSADEDSERDTDKAEDQRDGLKARAYTHLTLLATTPTGWSNLVALNNEAQKHIFHKPRIDYELLAEHAEGIIVLTGCLGGPVMGPLARGDEQGARDGLAAIIGAVGAPNTYVELMEHGNVEEAAVMPRLVELAREHGVGIVATNDAHYTREEQREAHKAWLLVQSKSTLANPKFQFHGDGYWLRTEDEMRALRPEPWWQEACDTTAAIAERCADRTVPSKRDLMPRFPTPDGHASNRDYLKSLLADGAAKLYGADWALEDELKARINEEFRVIHEAGMVDYFLVVHDLVSWARSDRPSRPGGPAKKPILVGPGRGSAGGSELAYLLGITLVPPRPYQLLFERFYERGRTEPPDIDIDFPQGRRQEVIQYLRDRWGAANVASIGTFMMSRSRAAIKAAARVLDLQTVGNKLAEAVPFEKAKPMAMEKLLDEANPATAEYRRRYAQLGGAELVHDFGSAFEDVVAGFSIHASGVIVSAVPLHDVIPLRSTSTGWVLQWTGPEAEEFGLLKVDVLGLRNLDIIEQAAAYIEQQTGEVIDPLALPDPDNPAPEHAARVEAAYRIIAEGRTAGLFQLESSKMTELAMQIAPKSLDDLSAVIALYRPGPMSAGMHTDYAARRRGEEPVDYRVFTTDPAEQDELATVLGETYGVWVFQEQLMRLGTAVAGFDAEQRSKLRKAVSKKKDDVMAAVGTAFREGAVREIRDEAGNLVKMAFSATTADALWDAMLGSAEYLFNKAHSTTYGYLSYMTAYYKANWPAAYAAATLAVTDGSDKRLQVLSALDREGVEVLRPDVNSTNPRTAPEGDDAIRIGLTEVRDVGSVGELVVAERLRGGEFTSLRDVFLRVQKPDAPGSAITSSHLRALIGSGAADSFGPRRGQMAVVGAITAKDIQPPQMEWGAIERSSRQRTSLLKPLGTHPLVALQDQLRHVTIPTRAGGGLFADRKPVSVARIPDENGSFVEVLGTLASWAERPYSRGRMAAITLEGSQGAIAGTIWDDQLEEMRESGDTPAVGDIVIVSGRVRFRSIRLDPQDDDSEEVSVKELTVNSLARVTVDDPSTGGWPEVPEALRPPRFVKPDDPSPKAPATAPDAPVVPPPSVPDAPAAPAPEVVVTRASVRAVPIGDSQVAEHHVRAAEDGIIVHRDPVVLPSQRPVVHVRPWDGRPDALGAPIVLHGGLAAAMPQLRALSMSLSDAKAVVTKVRDELSEDPTSFQLTVEVGDHAFHLCTSDWSDSTVLA